MAKTRSQTGNITIKKEEEDGKPTRLLKGVTNTESNRITKRKPPIINNRPISAQQIKVEEDTDNKPLLNSQPKYSNSAPRPRISQEKINQLIHYVVNDNMSVNKAARKVNISSCSGSIYYRLYKNDPEKRIPLPRNETRRYYTQEQIENLIRYINDGKMTVNAAAAKANVPRCSARYYYNRYLEDPNHNIPIPQFQDNYINDQKNELIGYIINDKMSISAASKKAKMSIASAQRFYHRYFKVQNPDIATPSHITTHNCYTQEQIKEFVNYIFDDKMSIRAASRKANMRWYSAKKHYRQYLNDNNMKAPGERVTRCTQDQKNAFIYYIVEDKMAIKAASKKANICANTGRKYHSQYAKDRAIDVSIPKRYTQEQKNELVGYINDKMSITAAAKKANMSYFSGHKYYRQYLKEHQLAIPQKSITQEQISELVGYIVDDTMSIAAASEKANMSKSSGRKYYYRYLKSQKRDVATLCL